MIGLSDIRDWMKTLGVGEHFYIGKLDNKQEKSIGVYQRDAGSGAQIAIGGLEATKTLSKRVSVLIHWNKNAKETENAAQYLYNKLLCCSEVMINDAHVNYIYLETPEPVDVGTDDDGVYERVIWMEFFYER